jgi:hypothetical protein
MRGCGKLPSQQQRQIRQAKIQILQEEPAWSHVKQKTINPSLFEKINVEK